MFISNGSFLVSFPFILKQFLHNLSCRLQPDSNPAEVYNIVARWQLDQQHGPENKIMKGLYGLMYS